MKTKLYIIIILTALIGATSCSDWLDVSPKGEIDEKEAFGSERKFKEVLTGAYIMLANDRLYGLNASQMVPEGLARNWTIPADQAEQLYKLGNHLYKEPAVTGLFSVLWSDYYRTILQLNILLEKLDETDVTFTNNNDKLLRAEALGLRAFIHLEALRFFGPVPDEAGKASSSTIPYVTRYTKNPNDLVSLPWATVIERIEKDLNDAEKLLEGIDPIIIYSNDALNALYIDQKTPEDSWQMGRQSRFNYYAVLATKARLYQWIGKKDLATQYAKIVIEAPETEVTNSRTTTKFFLSNLAYLTSPTADRNLVMRSEHIFGVHTPQMVNQSFKLNYYTLDKVNGSTFYLKEEELNIMYETTSVLEDYRSPKTHHPITFWDARTDLVNTSKYHNFRKYLWPETNNINRVSLIRLSELYFILIENTPIAEAKTHLMKFRESRAISTSIEDDLDELTRVSRSEREHRKEFLAEGQMFFFYKRHKYTSFPFPSTYILPSMAVYVLPKPDNQVIFE